MVDYFVSFGIKDIIDVLCVSLLLFYLYKLMKRTGSLNMFIGMNGFTLCSGIICEDLNGDDYRAVRLDNEDLMTIGYIKRKGIPLSPIGQKYIEEVEKYKEMILD